MKVATGNTPQAAASQLALLHRISGIVSSAMSLQKMLDELIALGSTSEWQNQYQAATESRNPVFGSITEPTTAGGKFTFEFGLFPVSLGGEAVEQFISLEDYFGATITSAQVQTRSIIPKRGVPDESA